MDTIKAWPAPEDKSIVKSFLQTVQFAEVQNVSEPANLVRRKYLTFEYLTENIYQYSHIKCYKLSVNG